ncbi:MAG: hypothetical protein ABIR06_21880, partial [Cyclobacteriaceae bacterium]
PFKTVSLIRKQVRAYTINIPKKIRFTKVNLTQNMHRSYPSFNYQRDEIRFCNMFFVPPELWWS